MLKSPELKAMYLQSGYLIEFVSRHAMSLQAISLCSNGLLADSWDETIDFLMDFVLKTVHIEDPQTQKVHEQYRPEWKTSNEIMLSELYLYERMRNHNKIMSREACHRNLSETEGLQWGAIESTDLLPSIFPFSSFPDL